MKYKCRLCKEYLTKDKFYPSSYRGNLRVQSACKKCKKVHDKYRRDETIDFFNKIKESTPCYDCHNFYPAFVMDYHHLNNKKFEVSKLIRGSRSSRNTILKEIQKCILVCSNCHRIRSHNINTQLKEK
jgi:hypothetical protein